MTLTARRAGLMAAASIITLGFATSVSAGPTPGSVEVIGEGTKMGGGGAAATVPALSAPVPVTPEAAAPAPVEAPAVAAPEAAPAKAAQEADPRIGPSASEQSSEKAVENSAVTVTDLAQSAAMPAFDMSTVDSNIGSGFAASPALTDFTDLAAPVAVAAPPVSNIGSVPIATDVAPVVTAPAAPSTALFSVESSSNGTLTDVAEIGVREGFNTNTPPPTGIYDPVNITGVGQMVTNNTPVPGQSLGTCTGTLINPRTVIFAAHCVNTRPGNAYGAATGGTPISFGFQQNNLPALRRWLGFDGAPAPFQTDVSRAIYNVEHVWYDQRSLAPESCTAPGSCFLQADVAIATLDTPAFDIPTWAMLFTPLDSQEHVTVTGYGSTGVGTQGTAISGGWRRRVAENYVSFLGSLNDRNEWLFGTRDTVNQNTYMVAFNDPNPNYNTANGKFDFGIFGANDRALPVEGITGPGDSGGPLILDRKFDIPLVLGVLSGGSRFFAAQPSGSYGTHNFYQPLHSYWDQIVANNPYAYVTNKEGDADWSDASHWLQLMDPSYQIVVNGELVNGVPSVAGDNITGSGAKFGDICFLTDCFDFTDPGESTVGNGAFFVAGGPGSENFVPNNVVANPTLGVRPRYYDVTLAARGTTTLRTGNVVVDLLTLDGQTKLSVANGASLRSLGEFNQIAGWTDVNGTMRASEAFFLTGFLTGTGTLRAPFVTSVGAMIAPAGTGMGTLTIDGTLVTASATTVFIDANRTGSDRLAVTGGLVLSTTPTNGPTLYLNLGSAMTAPRFGQSFTIATAGGGVSGTFGRATSGATVLQPELTYGANDVTVTMRAGRIGSVTLGSNPSVAAFANALDTLRNGSYNALYNLYGMIDVMDPARLTATLAGLAPSVSLTGNTLQMRQSRMLSQKVGDRLSVMGGAGDGSLSLVGAPDMLRMGLSALGGQRNVRMGLADLAPNESLGMALPEGVSGFVSGGVFGGLDGGSAGLAQGGQYGSYFGMGLEHSVAKDVSFGFAVGFADGQEMSQGGQNTARTTQLAAYGSHRLGGKAYVGGMASMETVDLDTQRTGFDGLVDQRLHGASDMTRYAANAELGINLGLAEGLTLTPRAQIGYDRLRLDGYSEQGSQIALQIDSLKTESFTARGGFKLAGAHELPNGWNLTPHLRADYVQRVSGGNDGMTVRFAAADHVGIALPLANGERSWGEVRGGLALDNGIVSFGAGFETAIARQSLKDDRAMVEFGVRF